jgi:hypothetical protein
LNKDSKPNKKKENEFENSTQNSFKDDVMSIFSAAIAPVVPERKVIYKSSN